MKRLEDALVAELCPGDDGQAVTSKTGLLLQQLEACALAEGECSSAHPLQVRPLASTVALPSDRRLQTQSDLC